MRRQFLFVLCYYCLYVAYLFVHPEGELLHWVSLVVVPLAGLAVAGRYTSPKALLQSIGLGAGRSRKGLLWVVVLGVAFQVLQLLNTRQRVELASILNEPLGFLMPVGALLLLVGTVATTEEVFFRGILQSRLAAWLQSEVGAFIIATFAFAFYHVPYAYLNPAWTSAGDFTQALRAAAGNGLVGGAVLGLIYWRSQHNLVASIAMHALIDLIPATRLVHGMIAAHQVS